MEKCILFTLTNTRQHPNRLRGSDHRTHRTPHPLVAVHLCQDSPTWPTASPNIARQHATLKNRPKPKNVTSSNITFSLQRHFHSPEKKDMHGFSNYTIYLDQSTATSLPCSFLQSCYFKPS